MWEKKKKTTNNIGKFVCDGHRMTEAAVRIKL